MEVQEAIKKFVEGSGKNKGRKPDERYASFDYCYGYFYSFYKDHKLDDLSDEKYLQISCLQLGFYLASWGMLRGSSFLLEKSARNFTNLINLISHSDPMLWEIDVDNYNDDNIKRLLQCKEDIIVALGKHNNPSDTLVTKIMMGVYANVPAFDQYFKKSMKVGSFNKKSLLKIKDFYEANKNTIDSYKIYTYNFLTGNSGNTPYTKAKLIDMWGFSNSLENSN